MVVYHTNAAQNGQITKAEHVRSLQAEQQQHLADLQNSRAAYEASLENVLASSSWKLTAPLRKLLGLFHRH